MMSRTKTPKKTEKLIIPENPSFATTQQACKQLDCSVKVIHGMVRRGELQGAKVGGRFKITQESIDTVLRRVLGIPASDNRRTGQCAA